LTISFILIIENDPFIKSIFSYLTVEAMRAGNSPRKAAQIAILRIAKYYPNFFGAIVSANLKGEYGAACNGMAQFSYSVPTDKGTKVQTVPCESNL
jgi:N4-(beta-N-acetylglucosaminyl)-L-asparaginase